MTQTTLDQLKKAVPDQPRLAPHVKTAGQMSESAFVEPPWLLEREGEGYIQVPRPLYRIAERADGQRTLQDLAHAVSESEGRGVSAENVRHLVATQLIPNGIVEARDGTIAPRPASARSALAIARMKTVNPKLLAGLTRTLQVVYWPPVLLVVLALTALTQGWLYVVHGVGESLHDAFYTPGFMLLVLTAIVLSAGFHELGHAAALRYAGGNPRSFGFGMYLMYPVFFTDVSDNYRLRRWARVRTDLGGFYFNLIFALGVFGLYVLTRQEVLLVMILLMNFEIIRQLLPIVRLDGYWTLADLTGIPDFFSRMGAFLRTILPIKHDSSSSTLPPLKWWGKAVFLGYILVSVPALVFLAFLMLRSVPRVLATAWDALGQQGQGLVQAFASGNFLGVAGALGQSLLLLLPVAGLLFSLYRLVTGIGGFLWGWSAGSGVRRGFVTLAGVAFAVLVYLLWAPQIALFGKPSPLYRPETFQPIGPDERLSVTDAFSGAIVQRTSEEDLPAWLPALTRPSATSHGGSGAPLPASGSAPAGGSAANRSTGQLPPASSGTSPNGPGPAQSNGPSAPDSQIPNTAGAATGAAGSPANGAGSAASGAGASGTDSGVGSADSAAGGAGSAVSGAGSAVSGAGSPASGAGSAAGGAGSAANGAGSAASGAGSAVGSAAADAVGAGQSTPAEAVGQAGNTVAGGVPGPASGATGAVGGSAPAAATAVSGAAGGAVPGVANPAPGVANPAPAAVSGAETAVPVAPSVATAVPAVATAATGVANTVPAAVPAAATAVPVEPVATAVPAAATALPVAPAVATAVPAIATSVPGAATNVPGAATAVATEVPAAATSGSGAASAVATEVPAAATSVPGAATAVGTDVPAATTIPAAATALPAAATALPAAATALPAAATVVPGAATDAPAAKAVPGAANGPPAGGTVPAAVVPGTGAPAPNR